MSTHAELSDADVIGLIAASISDQADRESTAEDKAAMQVLADRAARIAKRLSVFEAHAVGDEEIRYLRTYRALPPKGRDELDRFLGYLAQGEQKTSEPPFIVEDGE